MTGTIYETERLLIRPYTEADIDFLFDMYSRWNVMRYLGNSPQPFESMERTREALSRWNAVAEADPLFGIWAIVRREGGANVGTVLLKHVPLTSDTLPMPLSSDVEVGWHLHPDHWGNGYATEAASGALDRGFAAGMTEIVAIVIPANEASRRVALRLGMTYAGGTSRYYGINADCFRLNLTHHRRREE